jgi:hypothetical protein
MSRRKPWPFDGLDVRKAPDERDAMPGTRQHRTKESADGTGADNGNGLESLLQR